jgi:hypothetical protein
VSTCSLDGQGRGLVRKWGESHHHNNKATTTHWQLVFLHESTLYPVLAGSGNTSAGGTSRSPRVWKLRSAMLLYLRQQMRRK